jgi:NAD(P)-dependent dehydrogenase (short-subunit alcohol dehydrogenase family)
VDITDFAMDLFGLRGKNAIVTGGNTGLGQAFSHGSGAGGANVFVPSLADDDGTTRSPSSRRPVRAVRVHGGRHHRPGAGRSVVDECVDRLGSIDILINSAGICPLGEVLEFGATSGTRRCR